MSDLASSAHPKPLWSAPYAERPVDAVIMLPGSKSITNRALTLAALADRPSMIRRPLRARDTNLMADALRALGIGVEERGEDWVVSPGELTGDSSVDVGLAGTVMRFAPPLAALARGPVRFDGDPWSHRRPMGPLLSSLCELGVEIDDQGRLALPFVVKGTGHVSGGAVSLDSSTSSQFISGIMLSAARFDKGVDIRHVGPPVPSLPQLALTVKMLRAAGVEVDDSAPNVWHVIPGPIRARDIDVEPDLSNAAPFLAAAMVTRGRVTIPGWPEHTAQAGDALRELLTAMGASIQQDTSGLTVQGGALRGLDADLRNVGELVPVLSAVAAVADSPSCFRGIGHLRGHETDRLAALAKELSALGCDVAETEDSLTIRPRPLRPGVFATYDDHRLAQAGAVLGLVVRGMQVEDIATTTKTVADFVDLWSGLTQR